MRASRDQWQKRVEQWQSSGLEAEVYAAQKGLNAKTLLNWKYKLKRAARPAGRGRRAGSRPAGADAGIPALPLVELPAIAMPADGRFEIELAPGYRVRMPGTFEAGALRRLLKVLQEVAS